MATIWLDPGGTQTQDTTFVDAIDAFGGGGMAQDAQAVLGSAGSYKITQGTLAAFRKDSVLANAGRRISFGFRFTAAPSGNAQLFRNLEAATFSNFIFGVYMNSSRQLYLADNFGGALITGSTVLATGTDYRISIAYVITSGSSYTITLFINGVQETQAVGGVQGNIGGAAGVGLGFFCQDNWSGSVYIAHIYVDDNSSGTTDPGNIRVTAKRPNANGTANNFTTQIGAGGSGYGTGHSPQVNERPLNTANGWSVAAVAATTEEYNIENRATGDNDLTGLTLVDYMGWVYSSALVAETASIIVNNVTSNISLTNTNTLFTKIAASTTYPAGTGTDIGEVTSATVTTVSLYECGIIFAYIAAGSAVIATSSGIRTVQQAINRLANFFRRLQVA